MIDWKEFEDWEWLDKLQQNEVSIGGRYGHITCLREWAVEKFKPELIAHLSDNDLIQFILDNGYVPVKVNEYEKDENVYLIKKEELKEAIILKR